MMSYPKQIKIGCYDWTVATVDDLRDKEDGTRLYGQCDPASLTIRLNSGIEREQIKAETLWHETLHALWSYFHLEEKESEENAIACLATGVAMVMRDNPSLKRYFWEVWK